MTLSCKQTGATLDASFFVQGAAERTGRPSGPARSAGRNCPRHARQSDRRSEFNEIVRGLAELKIRPPSVRRVPLWSHPLVLASFVTLLGAFWVARKAVGLI